MNKRLRVCLLVPASLFVGILASEVMQDFSFGTGPDTSQAYRSADGEANSEWLVGRSAAMAVSHSPLVEIERTE